MHHKWSTLSVDGHRPPSRFRRSFDALLTSRRAAGEVRLHGLRFKIKVTARSNDFRLAGEAYALVSIGLISFAACYLPARRASRVDPVVALAEE